LSGIILNLHPRRFLKSNMAEQQETEDPKLEQDLKTWAEYPKQRAEELRRLAVQEGFDPGKVVLGFAFDMIAYDDANIFARPIAMLAFTPQMGRLSKQNYAMRADWETSLPEVPPEIKTHLVTVREELEGYDWEERKNYEEITRIWKGKVTKWMEDYFDTHPEMREAIRAYTQLEERVKREE